MKAKFIKKSTQILADKFDSRVPSNYKDLTSLPGVGPKMAHLVLQEAFNKVEGVSVDTHVHRISGRLKWTTKALNPGQTADQLQEWLPEDRWSDVNHLLVGFGQTVCRPLHPKCYLCDIRLLCPMKDKTKSPSESKRSKKLPRESQASQDSDFLEIADTQSKLKK